MDDLTVGGSPSSPTFNTGDPGVQSSSVQYTSDVSAANYSFNIGTIPILPGISIVSYSRHLITTSREHQEQLFLEQQANAVNLNPLFQAALDEALNILLAHQEATDFVNQKNDIINTQNDYIDKINYYRDEYNNYIIPSDNTHIDTMNAAVVTYNTAVDTHEAAITTYNAAISAYNTAIQVYNDATTTFSQATAAKQTADSFFADYTDQFNHGLLTQAQYDLAISQHNDAVTAYNNAGFTFAAALTAYNTATAIKSGADLAKTSADSVFGGARLTYTAALNTYTDYANNVSNVRDDFNPLYVLTLHNPTEETVANLNTALINYSDYHDSSIPTITDFNESISGFNIPPINPVPLYLDTINFKLILPNAPALPLSSSAKIIANPIIHDFALNPPEVNNPRLSSDEIIAEVNNAFNFFTTTHPDTILSEILKNIKLQQDFLGFFEDAKPVAKAYLEALSKAFVANTSSKGGASVGTGSGVSMGMLTKSLDSGRVNDTIANSIFEAFLTKDPKLASVKNQLQAFIVKFLNDVALFAALPTLGALTGSKQNGGPNSPIVDVTHATAFANLINNAVNSGDVGKAFLELLKAANPTANVDQLKQLADTLASNAQLFLLQVALSQLSQTLGIPDLAARVAATLDKTKGLLSFPITQDLELKDVLKNPLSVVFLKSFLAKQLEPALGVEAAQKLINDVIDGLLTQSIKNVKDLETAFSSSLQKALTEAGLSDQDAQNKALELASLGKTFTTQEIQSNYFLDTGLDTADIDRSKLIQQIVQQSQSDAATQEATVNQNIIEDAVNAATFSQQQISQRELRDRISDELVARGVAQDEALNLSTTAVLANIKEKIPAPVTGEVGAHQLRDDLKNEIIANLTPTAGAQAAQITAGQVVTTIFGPSDKASDVSTAKSASKKEAVVNADNVAADQTTDTAVAGTTASDKAVSTKSSDTSLSHLMDKQVANLDDFSRQLRNNKEFSDKLSEEVLSFLRPTLELFVFNQKLRDPASNLIHSQYTGIMYQDDVPLTWDHNVFV